VIRFPERFHASVTPGAHLIGIEPNYLESPPTRRAKDRPNAAPVPRGGPHFDFSALVAVLR
jgi:hypothetical protein